MADKVHHGTTVIDDTVNTQPPPPPYSGPLPPGPLNAGPPHSSPSYFGYPPPGPPPVVHGPVYGAAVVTVPAIVVSGPVGISPSATVCRSCHQQVLTRVEYKHTVRTHLCAALLCVIGCWPFIFLPYCLDSCQGADHYCSNCGAYIGSYQ